MMSCAYVTTHGPLLWPSSSCRPSPAAVELVLRRHGERNLIKLKPASLAEVQVKVNCKRPQNKDAELISSH